MEKLISEYKQRIADYDTLLVAEKDRKKRFNRGTVDHFYHALEIKRLEDLRQLCVQITKDLEHI